MSEISGTTDSISLSALERAARANPSILATQHVDEDDDSATASDLGVHSVVPPPAQTATPPAPPRPASAPPKPGGLFEFTGDTLLNSNVTPAHDHELLHKLAIEGRLSHIPLKQSGVLRAVVRECEFLIYENSVPHYPTTINDLRKLLALYDDYALENRPAVASSMEAGGAGAGDDDGQGDADEVRVFDRPHQIALFVARMKLLHCMQVAVPRETNASQLLRNRDYHSQRAANEVTDRALAVWLKENAACHASLIDEAGLSNVQIQALRIRHCSLEALWQSLLTLLRVWPRLRMCSELVRYFDELRARVAFFMCYRELAPDSMFDSDEDDSGGDDDEVAGDTVERKLEKRNEQLMGLNLKLFGLLDLNNMLRGAPLTTAASSARAAQDAEAAPLIDNWDMARVNREEGGTAYVHVNMDFVDECERVLHAVQMLLRSQAGFAHQATPEDRCELCKSFASLVTDEHVQNVVTLVQERLAGTFRSVIEDQFREQLFAYYIEPSELEQFIEYHPQEVHSELSCISKRRNADYRVLSTRFIEPSVYDVWTKLGLSQQFDEPAHVLLAGLTLNFVMRQDANGAKLEPYFAALSVLDPFEYRSSARGELRPLLYHLYDPMTTTGTLRFRYKLLQSMGVESPAEEVDYEHPLVIRSLNAYAVLYRGHMHACETFEHAFLTWLLTICLDEHIGGFLANGSAMQPLAARLMPDLRNRLEESLRKAEKRIRKWNPMAGIMNADEIEPDEAAGPAQAGMSRSRLPMHSTMTHF